MIEPVKNREAMPAKAVCIRCRYYYITWETDKPHGCKGFGFKSKEMPSIIVRRSDKGTDCRMFSLKTPAADKQ